MSADASRARSTGPFVQIVASATWFAAIEGLRSTVSSSSTCVSSCSCRIELAELLLGVAPDRVADLEVLALDLKTHQRSLRRAGSRLCLDCIPTHGPGERDDLTSRAPLRRSADAAAATVEPVV